MAMSQQFNIWMCPTNGLMKVTEFFHYAIDYFHIIRNDITRVIIYFQKKFLLGLFRFQKFCNYTHCGQ